MAYLGSLQPGQMRLNAEILEARWFSLDRLPRPLWAITEDAIAAALSLHRQSSAYVPPAMSAKLAES
jgi:hypothetical protein